MLAARLASVTSSIDIIISSSISNCLVFLFWTVNLSLANQSGDMTFATEKLAAGMCH